MVLYIDREKRDSWSKRCGALIIAAAFIALFIFGSAHAQSLKQHTFASPEEAVKAMIEALKANDVKTLEAIFGPGSKDLISSGDPVADQAGREQFVKQYEEKNRLEQTGDKAVLSVGNEDWPSPIPILKKDGLWRFDAKAGREEILARRIGRNELSTMKVCLAYVDAQREYAIKDRDSDGLLEYAQKFGSDKGKKNGLYWQAKQGEEQSPLGRLAAVAQNQGYRKKGKTPQPFFGYYYRILTGQGKNAPGGAYDYIVKGNMIGGFALVAYPAKYGSSGVMTFMVNHDGVVYQKDLGKNTEKAAQAMKLFDPDSTWKKAQ
ncbi:MAG: DUF2950 domain-containing protein [Desulfobacterota bacterium]|jgi:hypothetical protein|nr:DUF2950 domain-containing protein [Thermodesulfobacteriota bacterium]